ncbi:MAG: hypothetical protein QM791_11720 [Ferruginibacter sp.]
MQRKNLVLPAVIVFIIAAFAFTTKKQPPKKIYRFITATELAQAFARADGEQLILNIYPVKKSSSKEKEDLELQVLFVKEGQGINSATKKIDIKTFRQNANWYVRYLKQHDVQKDDIPDGYYLYINPETAKEAIGLALVVTPGQSAFEHSWLMPVDAKYNQPYKDTCPCNLLQTMSLRMVSDSGAGKCPPCKFLVLSGDMDKIISKNY